MFGAPGDLLRDALDGSEPVAVAEKLAEAMRVVGSGRAASLEAALGFAPGDIRRWCRARRDDLLREAATSMPADLTPWQRAGALAEMVIASDHHRAACHRRGGDGQWRHGPAIGLLIAAEQLGALPRTAMGIRNAIKTPSASKARPTAAFVRRASA